MKPAAAAVLVALLAGAASAGERSVYGAGRSPSRLGRPKLTPYFVGGGLASRGESATTPPPEFQEIQGEAPERTLRRLEDVLRQDRSRAELWTRKGELLSLLARPRAARGAFEEALRLDAESVPARRGLGKVLVDSGLDSSRGEALLLATLGKGPEGAAVLVSLSRLAIRRGEFDTARQHLEAAHRIAPGNPEPLYELGTLSLREGNNGVALRSFNRVVQLDPSNARAHIALGLVYAEYRERDRALSSLARAWHLLEGKGAAAREVMDKMRELDPYADPKRFAPPVRKKVEPRRSSPLRVQGEQPSRPAETKGAAPVRPSPVRAPPGVTRAPAPGAGIDLRAPPPEAATPSGPTHPEAEPPGYRHRLLRMAELYRRYGLYEEAAGSYHALIARDPNSDSARKAQASLAELETLQRPPREVRISQLRRLGGFLHQQRDRRGTKEALERILLQDPEDATAWRDLAHLSATSGSLGESLELTRRSLEVAPGNHPALLIQAHVLGRQRKFRQALVIYRSILETEPGPRVAEYAASMERSLRVFADVR